MKAMKDSNAKKKQYRKPAVTRFMLKAEEAVLGFCKSSGNSGPVLSGCLDPVTTVCKFHGS